MKFATSSFLAVLALACPAGAQNAQTFNLQIPPANSKYTDSSGNTWVLSIPSATIVGTLTLTSASGCQPDATSISSPQSRGSLATTYGTWAFGASTDSGGDDQLLLNGSNSNGGSAKTLVLENSCQTYAYYAAGAGWFLYNNANNTWNASAAPVSPDGSTLTPGQSGSLVTASGVWTISSTNLILLNGVQAASKATQKLEVKNSGQMYQLSSNGSWYLYRGSSWTQVSAP